MIGSGNATLSGGRNHVLFVAEPEARTMLNVTRLLRLGFGGGYRFVGNTGDLNGELSGWSATFSVGFALFRD